jgi:phospholipid/cholesterol/gamma-HCH transport system permease protein
MKSIKRGFSFINSDLFDTSMGRNKTTRGYLSGLGRIGLFTLSVFRHAVSPPFYVSETIRSIRELSTRSLLPVISVVAPFGMVIALQGLEALQLFGTQQVLGSILVVSIFRELSPGLAGIMMAAQGGSSVAAELGSMRVQDEIDAHEVMAVNPIRYLVVPRFIGLTLACPLVNTIAATTGIAGGYLVAVLIKGMNHGAFVAHLFTYADIFDLWSGVIKSTVFGAIIGMVSCYKGFTATGGAEGVGKAANDAVVQSIILFLGVNYFLSYAMYNVLG